MSRGQIRPSNSICADCSAPGALEDGGHDADGSVVHDILSRALFQDNLWASVKKIGSDPTWGSINRGVLVCDECCSIHRSLGRHVTQVKSVRKGYWCPTQLSMLQQLVSLGANSIWEHCLLDPSQNKQGRRKPNPRDPVHPTKADFIRAKYQFLAFVNKHKDSEVHSTDDLSRQLHSSVRTGNLETSLRLLSLGADPNFFHTEKGNNPLHVAAQVGQASQVELLVVYGADPGAFDSNGKTPIEHARLEGHVDLSDRLLECQYELTDRLAYYLCAKKPDHRTAQHFIIPEMADSSLDMSELAKAAKKKLQALPNHLFEELAMDVYDEVDRRENNAVWLQSQGVENSLVSDRQTVPFLPVNPEFSSTRNQGRQKLARFNAREFATLIIDILSDARRRQLGITSPSSVTSSPCKEKVVKSFSRDRSLVKTSSLSDDEPLYDSVASDEDYASIGDCQSIKEENTESGHDHSQQDSGVQADLTLRRGPTPTSMISFTESMGSSEHSDGLVSVEEFTEVKRGLIESQARVHQVVQINKDLKQEIHLLRNMVQKLMQENAMLQAGEHPLSPDLSVAPPMVHNGQRSASVSSASPAAPPQVTLHRLGPARPQSMFEPRNHLRNARLHKPSAGEIHSTHSSLTRGTKVEVDGAALPPTRITAQHSAESDYENANQARSARSSGGSARSSTRSHDSQGASTSSSRSHSSDMVSLGAGATGDSADELGLPSQDDVVKRTERITKKIQELLLSAQEGKSVCYATCADKIHVAVQDMAAIFPQVLRDEKIREALHLLTTGAVRLQEQCNAVKGQTDSQIVTQQVIQCAYNIAKAAKQLVMLFE